MAGTRPLARLLEVTELRVNEAGPLAHKTLAEAEVRKHTGAGIVGQWHDDILDAAPSDQKLVPGTILVAAGSPESIRRLRELARPITEEGTIIVSTSARSLRVVDPGIL